MWIIPGILFPLCSSVKFEKRKKMWMNVVNAPLTLLFVIFWIFTFINTIRYYVATYNGMWNHLYGNNMAFSKRFSFDSSTIPECIKVKNFYELWPSMRHYFFSVHILLCECWMKCCSDKKLHSVACWMNQKDD